MHVPHGLVTKPIDVSAFWLTPVGFGSGSMCTRGKDASWGKFPPRGDATSHLLWCGPGCPIWPWRESNLRLNTRNVSHIEERWIGRISNQVPPHRKNSRNNGRPNAEGLIKHTAVTKETSLCNWLKNYEFLLDTLVARVQRGFKRQFNYYAMESELHFLVSVLLHWALVTCFHLKACPYFLSWF